MNPGPLRRLFGCMGLIALLPTVWLLATDAITLVDAAVRAGATLVVVVVVGRLVGSVLAGLAGSFERDAGHEGEDTQQHSATRAGDGRRSTAPPHH